MATVGILRLVDYPEDQQRTFREAAKNIYERKKEGIAVKLPRQGVVLEALQELEGSNPNHHDEITMTDGGGENMAKKNSGEKLPPRVKVTCSKCSEERLMRPAVREKAVKAAGSVKKFEEEHTCRKCTPKKE